jgi:putative ABC transport system permease protein
MIARLALWIALRIVAAVAVVVPAAERADWRREWEAELQHRWASLGRGRRITWRTSMDLIRRALGTLPDAAWIRRQLTADADAVHDVAHGVRMLSKAPGFTAVALLVFAVGIGATTAIVSLADALLVRPLPLPQAERIMTLWQYNRATGIGRDEVAPGNAIDWVQRARSFEAVAAIEPWSVDYSGDGARPETLVAARVSERFFDVLGVPMLHGRAFLPQEFRRGSDRVAILSHGIWQDRFGGDSSIVGRAVRLDDQAYTIVGVLPPRIELRLFGSREPLVWLTKYFNDDESKVRGTGYWNVFGRLKPGVTIDEARAELDALSAQLAREYPQSNKNIVAQVVPLRDHLVGSLRDVLPVLVGAAGILLIVACANVANLLLARGVGRGREFAVRQALGAGRGRLVRQMLVESLLLAAAGGAAGLALARWSLDVIARLRPLDVARIDRIPIDARAAAIACGVTILAAIIAGLAPSIHLSRPAAASALREGQSGGSRRRVRNALVVAEVALALLLVVGAGLLVRSFLLIQRVDPGFSRDHVTALQVFVYERNDTPQKRMLFFQQAIDRMRALPGVAAAGAVSAMPFSEANINIRSALAIVGRPPMPPGDDSFVYTTVVAGDYFRAMGVPLYKGRLFEPTDATDSRKVVLVSRSAAQKFWPDAGPVGSRVRFRFTGTVYDAEVVGIVGEVRHEALDRPARPELFLPYPHSGFGSMTFVVRTQPGSPTTLQALKEQVWALDPLQTFYRTATLDELVSRTLVGRRFSLVLLGGFATAALLLAAAGLYGVMSFSTSQRTREFGVRMALGAGRREIVGLVVGEGLKLAGLGLVVGVGAALWMTRMLRSLLFGVTATDPVTFIAVGSAILVIASLSCYLPARRALSIDPVRALRFD